MQFEYENGTLTIIDHNVVHFNYVCFKTYKEYELTIEDAEALQKINKIFIFDPTIIHDLVKQRPTIEVEEKAGCQICYDITMMGKAYTIKFDLQCSLESNPDNIKLKQELSSQKALINKLITLNIHALKHEEIYAQVKDYLSDEVDVEGEEDIFGDAVRYWEDIDLILHLGRHVFQDEEDARIYMVTAHKNIERSKEIFTHLHSIKKFNTLDIIKKVDEDRASIEDTIKEFKAHDKTRIEAYAGANFILGTLELLEKQHKSYLAYIDWINATYG